MNSIDRSRKICYPTVQVPFCKCFNIDTMPIGAYYCPRCNAIVVRYAALFLENKKIEEVIVHILNHETIHWWLSKNIDEMASFALDNIEIENNGDY